MDTIPAVILVHAGAAFLVLVIGPVNILRPRRDAMHRMLGRTWVAIMYLTCGSSFFFGLEDGFTFLHGLSVFTIITVSLGVLSIVRGNRRAHAANMVGSYIGTMAAFGFAAFVPNRLIWSTAVTDPVALFLFTASLGAVALCWVGVVKVRFGAEVRRPAVVG